MTETHILIDLAISAGFLMIGLAVGVILLAIFLDMKRTRRDR